MDECSQTSPQSVNGPNTFDEALNYFEFSVDERGNIIGHPAYGSLHNAQGVPANIPHLAHLSPQGYSTQPIYHSHSQHAPPTRGIATTHHQGTRYSRASRRPCSTRFQPRI
jgi:hypothetical protein